MARENDDDLESFDDRLSVLEQGLAEIEKGQAASTEVLKRIEHRLFGNGQPGELGAIKARVAALELKEATDAGRREASTGWWKTLQPFVMLIVGALVTLAVTKLSK